MFSEHCQGAGDKIKSLLCQKKVIVFGKEIRGLFG